MFYSYSRISSALLLLALVNHPASSQSASPVRALQQPPPARLSCEYARQLMVAEVTGQRMDTSIYVFQRRGDADETLLKLTDLALRSPHCPAAYGARGLLKQRLARTDWIPKDAPGQKVGLSWREDAIYDLVLAA